MQDMDPTSPQTKHVQDMGPLKIQMEGGRVRLGAAAVNTATASTAATAATTACV